MKPFFISYSAATGAALIGASRPRGIEYGREIRCYEDQHPDQKRHHVYESERESRYRRMPADGRKRDFGPFRSERSGFRCTHLAHRTFRALSPASFAARAESRPSAFSCAACFVGARMLCMRQYRKSAFKALLAQGALKVPHTAPAQMSTVS